MLDYTLVLMTRTELGNLTLFNIHLLCKRFSINPIGQINNVNSWIKQDDNKE